MAEAVADDTAPSGGGGEPDEADSKFMQQRGPNPDTRYPLRVIYCEVCDDWPLEYVEYHPNHEKGKEWIEKNISEELQKMYLAPEDEKEEGEGDDTKKKRQKRGGKGVAKTKKKTTKAKRLCLARAPRGKRKYITIIMGLATYDIDLKVASKYFASRFSCGSSVTGPDEIVIQGDVKDDLFDIIPEKWAEIEEDSIEDMGDMKRA